MARFTREARTDRTAGARAKETTREVALRGSISALSDDGTTFELRQVYGPPVPCPMPERYRDTIIEAFRGCGDDVRALIQGIGRYDGKDRLSGLKSVERVSLLDPLDVPACLDEFRELEDGWMDGQGFAPTHTGLDWLTETFDRRYPGDLPLPYTYPTLEGGVQMEWSLSEREISLNIDFATHLSYWHRLDMLSLADDERILNLDNTGDWTWLLGQIRTLAERIYE